MSKEKVKIKVVKLVRFSTLTQNGFSALQTGEKEESVWIALGHFDAMVISPLSDTIDGGSPFNAVGHYNMKLADQNDGTSYYHPLYLLHKGECLMDLGSAWFVGIIRIHLSMDTAMDGQTHIEKEIEALAKMWAASAHFACYDTLELSDMVVVVHGNSLSELLSFSLRLRQIAEVEKAYTYCGVNYKFLCDETRGYKSNDKLESFSMRFSVRDPYTANEQICTIQDVIGADAPYSVTGVDDMVLHCTDMSTEKLIILFRKLFTHSANSPLSAFYDVTTRLGCKGNCLYAGDKVERIRKEEGLKKPEEPLTLTAVCETIHKLSLTLKRNIENGRQEPDGKTQDSWLKPLNELTNALVHMSRTPILDEFCFLMLDAVTAFLLQINWQHNNGGRYKDPRMLSRLYGFVDCWANMMEHILRMEGQLAHHPETRPMLYDIPVPILEYTLAFLQKCADMLTGPDESVPRNPIHFLLAPRLYTRIEAMEMFPPQPEVPALVIVNLPLHTLYEPCHLLCALCHEVSHFVGETCRCRTSRKQYYIYGVVGLAAKLLFGNYNTAIANELAEELLHTATGERMKDLQMSVIGAVYDRVKGKREFTGFIQRVFLKAAREKTVVTFEFPENKAFELFKLACVKLGDMFREAYADLCMTYLIELSPSQYVEVFLPELLNAVKSIENAGYVYGFFAIRCFVVLRTMWPEHTMDDLDLGTSGSDERKNLLKELEKLYISSRGDDEIEGMFPLTTINQLILYLKDCRKHLSKVNCADVSKMFTHFSDNAEYYVDEVFNNALIEHRRTSVERIHKMLASFVLP